MKTYTAKRRGDATRLLLQDSRISTVGSLEQELGPHDLIVLNESGTVPASLMGTVLRSGETVEVRLAVREGDNHWLAVLFGSGTWRDPTEKRGTPPVLRAGDTLVFAGMMAVVQWIDSRHERLLHLFLNGDLFAAGEPVQYSYHREPLTMWDAQTPTASLAWSVEAPSALFPLSFERLLEFRRHRPVVTILHGAGLSSTGDPELDALLPLPEPYRIPPATAEAILEAKRRGGRVIAWGTSTARALESYARSGSLSGMASLKLGAENRARLVDGLITGFHEPGTSHYALEEAFVSRSVLEAAFRFGKAAAMVGHEYGDLCLLWKETV